MASQPTQLSEAAAAGRRAHLKEVTNEPQPDSLGGELRAARLKLGADIAGASKFTKIKPEYLEALEEGRLEALPGRTYAIGFLRTYASFLKLDPAATVARLKAEYPAEAAIETASNVGLPEVQSEMRVPQGALIIVGIIIIAMIYAGVYLFRSANEYMEQRAHPAAPAPVQPLGTPDSSATPSIAPQSEAPIGSPVTSSTDNIAPAPSSVTTAPAPAPTVAPAATTPSVAAPQASVTPARMTPPATTAPAPPPVKPAPTPKPVEPTGQTNAHAAPPITAANDNSDDDTAAEPPSPVSPAPGAAGAGTPEASAPVDTAVYDQAVAGAPRSFGTPAKDSRVMLRATDTVFLRIETEGPRNQVLFEGTLNKGEVYHVPKSSGVILTTRNGGAVDLFVDGAAKGAAGPAGIALKGLPLDPDGLKSH